MNVRLSIENKTVSIGNDGDYNDMLSAREYVIVMLLVILMT